MVMRIKTKRTRRLENHDFHEHEHQHEHHHHVITSPTDHPFGSPPLPTKCCATWRWGASILSFNIVVCQSITGVYNIRIAPIRFGNHRFNSVPSISMILKGHPKNPPKIQKCNGQLWKLENPIQGLCAKITYRIYRCVSGGWKHGASLIL